MFEPSFSDCKGSEGTDRELLLAMPDVNYESDTNAKIAQGDDEVTKYTKVVIDLEDA